jgi:hypothetical protein
MASACNFPCLTINLNEPMPLLRDECFESSNVNCFCIEFHLDEHHRRGFHTSQLITYSLDPNPAAENDKDAPPQMLSLAFSTADVVILGWRLSRLTTMLQKNELATVAILSKRYADLERQKPFVSAIEIKPVGEKE